MIRGLHHFALPMPRGEETKAREFYAGVLGFKEIPKPAELSKRGGVWFELEDGRQLHFQSAALFTPLTGPHPAFRCPNLDALKSKLFDAGCEPRWDEAWDGVRRFYVDDPFGNRLEMLEMAE